MLALEVRYQDPGPRNFWVAPAIMCASGLKEPTMKHARLLWAVSTEDGDGATDEGAARETALFAIAYYTPRDRETYGDALDRRIRGRVLEVWNTDRPGRPR